MESTAKPDVRPAAKIGRRRRTLRVKVMALTAFSSFLAAAMLLIIFSLQVRNTLGRELEKRGRSVGLEMANNLAFATFSADTVGLQAAANNTLRDVPDVAFVVLRGTNGEVLAKSFANELGNLEVGKLPLPQGLGDKPQVQPIKSVGKVSIVEVASPIMLESKAQEADSDALGLLGVGMDTAPKKEPAVAGKKRVGSVQIGFNLAQLEREVGSTVLTAILFCLLALAICLVLAYFFSRMLTVPIERLVSAAAGIARGELQQEMAIHGNDEISDLARAFATMSDGLRSMIADLRGAAQEIEREASNILSTSSQQSAMASQQASAINETSTTVSEIAQTSKQATEHADSVIQLAQRSEELSRDGQKVVEEAMTGMEKLAEQVRAIAQSITELSERTLQIGDIIATVKDLAEQSNLLALNASIEAAKAGEHGRGFAVVAMEMRNLAEQSKVAAGEVRVILGDVQKGTRGAVGATEEGSKRAHAAIGLAQSAGTSILGLADVIRDSSLAARQIANNTRQQTIGVEQIVSAISELSSAMADTLEGTKRIENVAGSLTTLSKRLSDLVGRYQV